VGSYRFIAIHQRSAYDSEVRISRWNSRAWTLQEAALSPRLIYFLDDEMFFQCKEHDFRETLDERFLSRDMSELQEYFGWTQSRPFYDLRNCNTEEYWNIVQDYCKRHMSYQNDAMNAFLGILQAFEKYPQNFQTYGGIPFACKDLNFKETGSGLNPRSYMFAIGLCWNITEPIRRPGFPSWSWVGWRLDSTSLLSYPGNKYGQIQPRCSRIETEAYDERPGILNKFQPSDASNLSPTVISPKLRIKGLLAPFQLINREYAPGDTMRIPSFDVDGYVVFTLKNGEVLPQRCSLRSTLRSSLQSSRNESQANRKIYIPEAEETELHSSQSSSDSSNPQFFGLILAETEGRASTMLDLDEIPPGSIFVLAIRLVTAQTADPLTEQANKDILMGERAGVIWLRNGSLLTRISLKRFNGRSAGFHYHDVLHDSTVASQSKLLKIEEKTF
jgi:hypothetical protein